MKAKRNIPEVPKPSQVTPETEPQEPLYRGLSLIKRLVPFLGGSETFPSADDCENTNRDAFYIANSLVELVTYGEEALQNETGNPVEPILRWAGEGIALQLEIMRLASTTLFELYHEDRFLHKPR
jgi:hypothetical protein